MPNTISEQFIIDCLNTDYGIEVATLTLLPLGADMNASVYKAQTHDQSSYFVKLKRGHHHDIGIAIVELLHDAGIQQIIPPSKQSMVNQLNISTILLLLCIHLLMDRTGLAVI